MVPPLFKGQIPHEAANACGLNHEAFLVLRRTECVCVAPESHVEEVDTGRPGVKREGRARPRPEGPASGAKFR